MLIQPSIDEMQERYEDKYLLATLASRRAKDLLQGKRSITEEREINPVSQAAKEIAEGLIGSAEEGNV